MALSSPLPVHKQRTGLTRDVRGIYDSFLGLKFVVMVEEDIVAVLPPKCEYTQFSVGLKSPVRMKNEASSPSFRPVVTT